MGRKGSMNLQVITDSFVKDQSRRRNCQALSARIPTTPIKAPQKKLSSPEITSSSPTIKINKPVLRIQTVPKSAIPKASDPRYTFPLSTVPKSAAPDLRISTLVTAGNKVSGPKTPLSASAKKNQGLSLQTPSNSIPEIDAPDTPVNVIYANAFFDNKTREDKETEAINKKVLKQQRKENIRNMRRERMKQPKDIRVALILGRLYDASHYELGPLAYWSDPDVENNEELKPKENEPIKDDKLKPKKMIQINPDEVDSEPKREKNFENEINHDKTNNINAHPAWIPVDACRSDIACQRSASIVNGKLVKKNKKQYVAVASFYSNLYDPVLMKKREEEESLRLIEQQKQSSIITELKPLGKSINYKNQITNNNSQYQHYNKQNFNKVFNTNKFIRDENYNDDFNVTFRENRSQPQPNKRNNYYNKSTPTHRSPTQLNSNYVNNDNYSNQTYSYSYVYQYPVYQYYDPNMVQNYEYTNYGTGYGQNYSISNNNYYGNSSYGSNNSNQNSFKPRMNYQNNNNQNSYNRKSNNDAYNFRKFEKKVNI